MGLIDLLLKRKKETEDAGDEYDAEKIAQREAMRDEMERKRIKYPQPEDQKKEEKK